jgi:hypothetical protein
MHGQEEALKCRKKSHKIPERKRGGHADRRETSREKPTDHCVHIRLLHEVGRPLAKRNNNRQTDNINKKKIEVKN